MPVVPVPLAALNRHLTSPLSLEDATRTLPQLGGDVDRVDEDTIHIEYFPDRSDLVSIEGIARAVDAFTGGRPGLRRYDVGEPTARLEVDPSVAEVRPYILACGITGLPPLDDERLVGLMDFQERLANGIGRRRRRVAIGIHDASRIRAPYRYTTATSDTAFHPLQGDREMSVKEILSDHRKGREWSHLLPEGGPYPIILDADDHVLSLPPIINGTRTELRIGTTDLVLDLTGPDLGTLHSVLAILATALMDQGGTLQSYEVVYPDHPAYKKQRGPLTAPRLDPLPGTLRASETHRVLGLELSRQEIAQRLERLGHDAQADPEESDTLRVLSPPWRADLLHEWDLIEDVAKGHGYPNFIDAASETPTYGSIHPVEQRARLARTAMIGLAFLEATTLTLTSMSEQYGLFHLDEPQGDARPGAVRNPITTQHTILRTWITPGLFRLLQKNKHRDYPQSLFEVGQVVAPERGHKNAWRLAAVHTDPKASYSLVKGIAQAVLRDLDVTAHVEEDDHPSFIPGRVARWVDPDGNLLGRCGEYHPQVLEGFELNVPVVGFEFDLDKMLPIEDQP